LSLVVLAVLTLYISCLKKVNDDDACVCRLNQSHESLTTVTKT